MRLIPTKLPVKILMKNDPEKLDLIKPAITILILIILIGFGVLWLNKLDQQRKKAVYNEYKQETEAFISHNQQPLIAFFAQVSDKHTCDEFTPVSTCISKEPIKDHIDHQLSHDLKDWSSTLFFAPGSSDGQINLVRLSGDISDYSGYGADEKYQVIKLLKGQVEELPWNDYTYDLVGKEVVIPVKNDQGKIIGAIVRGVIEEKSF